MTPSAFGALQEGHAQLKQQIAELSAEMVVNVAANQAQFAELSNTVSINTVATKQLMDWLNAFEGTFKVLNGLGKFARPIGWIAGAVASFMALWHLFFDGKP